MIINGSPRGFRSNSKEYIEIFKNYWGKDVNEYNVVTKMDNNIEENIKNSEDMLFVCPLSTDSIPAVMIDFLKKLEQLSLVRKITLHIFINCGFLEPKQCSSALETLKYYAEKNGYTQGMTLCLGAGEAILKTPFSFIAKRKMKQFAKHMKKGNRKDLDATMPLTKRLYIIGSKSYWLSYGKRYGINEEQMRTLRIEE